MCKYGQRIAEPLLHKALRGDSAVKETFDIQ